MAGVPAAGKPAVVKKSVTKIFFGVVLIFLSVFILAAALYWPEFQKQSASAPARSAGKTEETATRIPPAKTARNSQESAGKEGYLWLDQASGQYIATLGQVHGAAAGGKLNVYDGTDLLGQVTVDRAMKTVSYVHSEKSVNLDQNNYYRIVME